MEGGPMLTWPGEGCLSVTGLDVSETPKTTGNGSPFCFARIALLLCHARTRTLRHARTHATQHNGQRQHVHFTPHARLAYRDKPPGARSPREPRERSMPEGPSTMFERFFSDARSFACCICSAEITLAHLTARLFDLTLARSPSLTHQRDVYSFTATTHSHV
jgi:hypothetical protein